MKRLAMVPLLCTALLVATPLPGAPPPREAASQHYRLAWFEPAGGATEMASTRYRLRAVVSPPLSGVMDSEHYSVRPLLRPPPAAPGGYSVVVLR